MSDGDGGRTARDGDSDDADRGVDGDDRDGDAGQGVDADDGEGVDADDGDGDDAPVGVDAPGRGADYAPDRDATDRDDAAVDGGGSLGEKYPEPEEYDPSEQFGDPERDLPSVPEVEIPTVRNPADDLPDPSEVDDEIKNAFWTAVLWTNVAGAGLILGPLYALLQGGTTLGAIATVVGALAAFRVYQTVRAFHQREGADDES
ncbi:hypothetical protein RYH80_04235 [Halobaculum sp. MBLA0147]|uniref:DUF7322 domain-containing protein n=1 Tax=Halobaculum sp. MBLA0147 TaxID=3079934 RepID=UPI00352694E9